MKRVFFVLAAIVPLLVSAKPVFSFVGGKADGNLSGIKSNGKWYKKNISSTLDGENALVAPNKITGAQTYIVTVEYASAPTGVILSRHRAEKKYHGIELGFADKNPYAYNGNRLGFHISDAGGEDGLGMIFQDAPAFEAKTPYTFVLRFTPGSSITVFAIDCKKNSVVYSKGIVLDHVKSISEGAGNGIMIFGARRQNSKSLKFNAPAGTEFKRISIYDRAMSDAELTSLLGVKLTSTLQETSKKRLPAPRTIHVNAETGDDSRSKTSQKYPLKTIQAAADMARPGDTVLIAPGVYFETPKITKPGTPDRKIIFKASGKPGSVIITAADKKLRTGKAKWECVDEKLQLYRTKFSHSPCRMLYSGVDLFPYNSLDELNKFAVRHFRVGKATEGSKKGYIYLPAAYHGFYFDDASKYLYVRLHHTARYGSRNPADHVIAAGAVTAPGSNGHHIYAPNHSNLYIDCSGDANIVLDGITFETPGAAGVLTHSGNLVIRNCVFKGCRFGAWSRGVTEGVFIENCHYDQAHAYHDALEVIRDHHNTPISKEFPSYHWTRKRNYKNSRKLVNYETGIAGGSGRYWHIRNCDIIDSFEGLSTWGMSNTKHWRVYGNNMQRHVDNAVEAENHSVDLRVHNNLFVDIFEPISYQPNSGMPWPGPVFIYRNVFYNTKEVLPLLDLMGGTRGSFKMGIPGVSWQRVQMNNHKPDNSDIECRYTKRVIFVPYPGFMVFNNTILLKEHGLLTLPMPINSRSLTNVRFFNNIIENADLSSRGKNWDGDLFEFYRNAVVESSRPDNMTAKITEHKGFFVKKSSDLKLNKEYTPAAESPVIGKGSLGFREPDASVDIGAVHRKGKFSIVSGPGTAVDVSKLSPFRQKVFYNATMLRAEGPVPGEWAVYYIASEPQYPEPKKPYYFNGAPMTVDLGAHQKAKSVTVTFRAADKKGTILVLDRKNFGFTRNGDCVTLTLNERKNTKKIAEFSATRDEYITVKLSSDGVSVNGKKAGDGVAPQARKCLAVIGYNPVFDIVFD